ncbi:MAG: aminotransferase class III-fold pyridoxal phosphate-dependent enzyme [Bilophila wadsworthia]
MLCESIKDAWGEEGRVHFNVGGSQAIEDSLKLVRNACGGKSLMLAFEGGYHGRTLGASSITSSYRYRRRYGHFGERALFVLPVLLPLPLRQAPRRLRHVLRRPVRAPVRNRILRRVGPQGRGSRIRRVLCGMHPGHGRLCGPAGRLLPAPQEGPRRAQDHARGR